MLVFFILINTFISYVLARNEQYIGHKVYSIKFDSQEQQDKFNGAKSDVIDFWRKPCFKYGVAGRAMVPLSYVDWFEEMLHNLGIDVDMYINDVYEYLNEREQSLVHTSSADGRVFDFDGYYRYSDIFDYLDTLQNSNTNLEQVVYGVTEENRSIVYLKITNDNTTVDKPVIIIDAGINPREWITVSAALKIANEVLGETRLMDAFDWIIVPLLNPDGYEYSHTTDRMWSKSRSLNNNLGFICPGVNINRNFDIDWSSTAGSSSSACSHLFRGVEPFSEIESQVIQHLITEYGNRTRLYISLQNNGGFITYPWQYEKAASGMFIQHHLLGLKMIEAMNSTYNLDVGSVAAGDRASGTSSDFAQRNGISYSYNIEIYQGDDGVVVPEDQIAVVVEDVWRAVLVAADNFV